MALSHDAQSRLFPDGGALVIGGSGGLGSQIVRTFAANGSDVAFTYNSRRDPAEAMAEEIRATGRRSGAFKMDLTNRDEIVAAINSAAEAMNGLHTVVYAAGAVLYLRYIPLIEPDRMAHHVESDVMGFFNVVQNSIPHLRKSRGSIVACCSSGIEKWPIKDALSVVPKSAVAALAKGVAREEGRFGIRANVIGTGVIDAGVTHTGVASGDVPQNFLDGAVQTTPLGRLGDADDIAEAALFLASSRAKFITGQVINVDGGWSI